MKVLILMIFFICLTSTIAFINTREIDCIDCEAYVKSSAITKLNTLWHKITESSYSSLPSDWYSPVYLASSIIGLAKFTKDGMNEPFDRFSDEFPIEEKKQNFRNRFIHTYGTIAQVAFKPEPNTEFTGMFADYQVGVIRCSLAAKPDTNKITPGFGLKFLRDGALSADIIAMYGLDGQSSLNFLEHQHKNWISHPNGTLKFLADTAFEPGSKDSDHLTVAHVAAATKNGTPVENPFYPRQIYFIPNEDVKTSIDSSKDFRMQLAAIKPNTKLFDIWSAGTEFCSDENGPAEDVLKCKTKVKIGELYITSEFVASEWGDKGIYFQHGRVHRKKRLFCQYEQGIPGNYSDYFTISGDRNAMCFRGEKCPVFGWFSKSYPIKTGDCPWDRNIDNAVPKFEDPSVYGT